MLKKNIQNYQNLKKPGRANRDHSQEIKLNEDKLDLFQ